MISRNTTTPTDLLIETIAALLVRCGGYKDAAEAVQTAAELLTDIGSTGEESIEALDAFRNLVLQAQGATNLQNVLVNGEEDASVRFVADDNPNDDDDLGPEVDPALYATNPDDAVASLIGSLFPGAKVFTLNLNANDLDADTSRATLTTDDGFIRTPYGLFRAA